MPQESSAQAVVNGGSAQLVHPQRSDTNHRQGGILNDSVGSNLKTQGDLPDNILLEQLAGIQGAIDAMENNTTTAEDDERFSLFMNVIDNDEDLGNVLNDMPWNFM